MKPKYAAFSALDPFFEIVQRGLSGLVDGEHYFDTIAENAIFEFRYLFRSSRSRIARLCAGATTWTRCQRCPLHENLMQRAVRCPARGPLRRRWGGQE